MRLYANKNSRGDTIVEVLISMVVLATVLATAYATTSRSLQTGVNAQQRDQALLIGQEQVELLKNADVAGKINMFQSAGGGNFCINPDQSPGTVNSVTQTCTAPSNNNYEFVDKWQPSQKIFSINVSWKNQNRTNQITLYFKGSDSYIP